MSSHLDALTDVEPSLSLLLFTPTPNSVDPAVDVDCAPVVLELGFANLNFHGFAKGCTSDFCCASECVASSTVAGPVVR